MTAACEAHGIKLASNQIEFNLARTLPLNNGLLQYMQEKGITCLACEFAPVDDGIRFPFFDDRSFPRCRLSFGYGSTHG